MTEVVTSALAKQFGVTEVPSVTDVDTEIINSGPAIYANKLYSTITPQGMRLTFAEMNPASLKPAFRSAVFLSFSDAAALMDLLERQLRLLQPVDSESEPG